MASTPIVTVGKEGGRGWLEAESRGREEKGDAAAREADEDEVNGAILRHRQHVVLAVADPGLASVVSTMSMASVAVANQPT